MLYPDRGLPTPFRDRAEAGAFVDRLVEFLKEILAKADEITPKYALTQRVSVIDVLKLLPKTNCRQTILIASESKIRTAKEHHQKCHQPTFHQFGHKKTSQIDF